MFYYQVAILGSALKPLTYSSDILLENFSIVEVPLKKRICRAVVLQKITKPDFKTLSFAKITNLQFSTMQAELAKFIAYYYVCEIGMVFDIFEPCNSINFIQKEFIKSPNLSENQQKAFEFCNQNKTALIFGDTGSGKSEIYISLIAKALNEGKQALFLMPEISLTPQMTKRLESYFGSYIGVWHSKISPKKKSEILTKFQSGEIKLIAGARSALFLPFNNLGIIIVDEEHDESYKSSSKPRYNARDLALFLSSKFDIKTILGSATPSLTTFAKQPYFRLKGTFFKSQKKFLYDKSKTKLSEFIVKEIQKSLQASKQVVVFLPTRANFKYMVCSSCGAFIQCPFCTVSMSFHKEKNAFKCHYCGYSTFAKIPCQKCGGEILEARKMGTSELVYELKKIFPNAVISKFDRDEITTQKKLESALQSFNEHKIDILVGTQMLSKGHDYHNVDLAVIMGIDEHLNYPDYKAREKTLALAMQVSGRAGRAGFGRVVLQTKQIDFFKNYIDNYDDFLKDENGHRNPLYPPHTRLLRLLISHKNSKNAQDSMQNCMQNLKKCTNIEIIGYGKAGIELIASKFRYEILIRSHSHKTLIKAANLCDLPNVEIDMDPLNFS